MDSYNKLNKVYRLTIQKKAGVDDFVVITNPISIDFNIDRGVFSGVNSMDLTIYNLGEKYRNILFQDSYDFSNRRLITLEAGYESTNLSLIFSGTLMRSYPQRQGSNIVNKLYAFDGALDTQVSQTFETWKEPSLQKALTKLSNSITGIKTGVISIDEKELTRPIVLSGNTFQLIQTYAEGNAFIDLGTLHILKDNDVLKGYMPIIHADTGLLGVPERQETNLSVKMIFEPRIIVGQLVKIESGITSAFNGEYKVIGLSHKGSFNYAGTSQATTTIQLFVGSQAFGGRFNVVN